MANYGNVSNLNIRVPSNALMVNYNCGERKMRIFSGIAMLISLGALMLMTLTAQTAASELSAIKSVKVKLQNEATGACWTNLKEAQEYAEEKLQIKGVKVVKAFPKVDGSIAVEPGMYWLRVQVGGSRIYKNDSGPCAGYVKTELYTATWIEDVLHLAVLNSFPVAALEKENFNYRVITMIQKFLDELN
jgi:hypothetical protein